MNTQLWDKAKDLLQLLVLPTLAWSLWVSRSVEVMQLQIAQQASQLQEARGRLDAVNARALDTEGRLVKIETTLLGLERSLGRIEHLLERMSTRGGGNGP
jgi:hypothetical protein